ncbi:hypothetical protein FHS18_004043 [Paenibacillus phyllosphaerae]|uniref:Microcin J25-processing protein McjB C-terminal domain-containing protein n=1 Tax=Paenibacillus phyllosphaerae TaxID=274593 RepID=A0A7W5B025_9BACL|nr:lasso peptide biosynthesis B2 protein [Paenibacillus phyllosphaerae]MBB3111975.1 hypothetical protein [Paenibacillus phyllosphaerae]
MKRIILQIYKYCITAIYLVSFDINLKRLGFNDVFTIYKKKYADMNIKKVPFEDLYQQSSEYLKIIDRVCAVYPFEAKCMHRSFLAYRILRKKFSIPVSIVIGVKKFPFYSHAWVMLGDKNINESEEFTKQFKVILRG